MGNASRKLGVSLLALILLALAVWSVNPERDDVPSLPDRSEPSDEEVRAPSPVSGAESDPTLSIPAATASIGSAGQEGRAELADVQEFSVGGRFEAEPVDPDWAPRMAATLDNVVRSLGGAAREVKVECGSSRCRAIILHYPSLFALDEDARNDVLLALMDDFGDAMGPSVVASLGLDEAFAVGLVELSPDEPLGSLPPEEAYGTVFVFTRASLPNSSD
jgi:hypothetical protein